MMIKIEALDTLFCKDGKPFSMGEESWADGIFPPPPSVIYGALRSAFFSQNPNEFKNANTTIDPTKNLEINGIYFEFGNDIYFPIPLDVVKKKNNQDDLAFMLNKTESIELSNSPLPNNVLKPSFIDEVETVEDGLINLSTMQSYLQNKIDSNGMPFLKLSELVQSEPKIGIGRENQTRKSSEGKLYRVGMRRLEEMKKFKSQTNKLLILVNFSGLPLCQSGFLKFGAESKIASYKKYKDDDFLNINPMSIQDNEKTIFKLYLLTPAIFEQGWKPNLKDNQILKGLDLELVSASIGKPVYIGGFDMQKKIPKPMRKAVPQGSVYYFRTKKSFPEIFESLSCKSISESDSDKEGYGICLIGGVKW